MADTQANSIQRGIVKQVLSGDSLVIRGYPKGGPPPEKQINLAYVQAPKVAKRVTNPDGKATNTSDEPYAWEAREFLRKKLVGKEVGFKKEYTVPFAGNQRECGIIFLDQENVVDSLVASGLVDVIKRKQNTDNPDVQRLLELEAVAQSANLGKHSSSTGVKRTILPEGETEADKLVNKTLDGIIDHVISGSTLRIAVEVVKNTYQVITLMLSGIRAPGQGEPFGGEAKFFTESRLLNRDVKVRIESVNSPSKNQSNQAPSFTGSIICNGNNIGEHLLKEGMAKCLDWTLAQALDSVKLRAAETEAKKKQLRIWKDYTHVEPKAAEQFMGKVIEVINADALMIENNETKEVKKIFLASIRPPPRKEAGEKVTRVLYDVPFMFEAREFLRTRLIGKKVRVVVDYIQPKSDNFPEKVCASVFVDGNVNVAEALLAKGLATTVRYRPDDESRSSCYDALREAESRAQTKKVGLHGNPEKGVVRIVDLSTDVSKAKSFMPFLSRNNTKRDAVVEHIYSASRIKLFIPKENCCLNFILAGVATPRAADAYGPESTAFVKSLILQRTVQIAVDNMDKVGNFIGSIFFESKNLALELLKTGFASIRDARGADFRAAEDLAKKKRLNIWKDYKEEQPVEDDDNNNEAVDVDGTTNGEVNGTVEKLDDRTEIIVTQVSDDLTHLFVQLVKQGPALATLMEELRQDLNDNPPLPGAYTPKTGDVVAAKFSADGQWYRVRIDKILDKSRIEVTYIDYGNKEYVKVLDLAPLPDNKYSVGSFPEGTKRVSLAFVALPDDKEVVDETRAIFEGVVFGAETLLMRVEFKDTSSGLDAVTLVDPSTKKDIVMKMVEDGLFMLNRKDRRRERKLIKIQNEYRNAQESAKKNRLNLWQYGDFTEDDAREFGFSNSKP